jgi:hypothetical protein
MNQHSHLREDQLVAQILGEGTWQERNHTSECVACREELRWLESSLRSFRDSVHGYAATQSISAPVMQRESAFGQPAALRWALALAALLLLFAVPAYRRHQQLEQQRQARYDAALLDEIDDDISSPVPAAMEPLASLAYQAYEQAQTSKQSGVRQ